MCVCFTSFFNDCLSISMLSFVFLMSGDPAGIIILLVRKNVALLARWLMSQLYCTADLLGIPLKLPLNKSYLFETLVLLTHMTPFIPAVTCNLIVSLGLPG